MRLLIVTQKVDLSDDILGFFHGWVKEFAKYCDKLTVICLGKGEYKLPGNVTVLSLGKGGKEKRFTISDSRFTKRIKYIYQFYRLIIKERKNYDQVFVHMNSEYIVLAGWLWKLWRKPISLWYVHRALPWQLKIAEKFVTNIFTASRESCNLQSKKIKIIGHGIDLDKFQITKSKLQTESSMFNIIYVGRISRIKNQSLLIKAVDILANQEKLSNFAVQIIGSPIYADDREYFGSLNKLVKEKKLESVIKFIGSVSNNNIVKYYEQADLSINLCPTGGVDKAVLESMAGGVPVLVLNQSFREILDSLREDMMPENSSPEKLAECITQIMAWPEEKRREVSQGLAGIVREKYALDKLIKRISVELRV